MSSSEPRLQALHHELRPASRATSRNDARFGYGGIGEKVSRLNDILRSLEARRSLSAHSGAQDGYSSVWPPSLHNSARLWETQTALQSHGLNMLDMSGRSDQLQFAEGADLAHQPAHGMPDNSMRHRGSSAHPTGMQNMGHLGSISSTHNRISQGVLSSMPNINVCRVPYHWGRGNEGHSMGYHHCYYPHESGPFPAHCEQHLDEGCHNNFKLANCQVKPPFACADLREQSGSLNVIEIGQAILARLERLENQQEAPHKAPKVSGLFEKGSARKVGNDQRLPMRKKNSFGEKGLLQSVRRRVKDDMASSFWRQDFSENKNKSSKQQEQDEQIEKRLQRLEKELELCWSAINQLCIDNEQFREEQQRFIQRTGPLHQLNENQINAKPTNTTQKCKVTYRTKKRGLKPKELVVSKLEGNDSSG